MGIAVGRDTGRTAVDIAGTTFLWKNYDVAALPLNVSLLSEKNADGKNIKELYFDGMTTLDGRVRAFMRIAEVEQSKGVVLYMPHQFHATDGLDEELNNLGYTVATLDYLGESDVSPWFTIYPKSLSNCNARGITEFEATEEAKASCWYVWTCIARRALLLLKEKYNQDLFAVGSGFGGSTVFKLCTFDDGLKAAVTLLNIIPKVTGAGNRIINYHAALDNAAYAPNTVVPLMIAAATNDEDGSFDEMAELAHNTESLKCFRAVERAFSCGISVAYGAIDKFFDDPNVPKATIKAVNSENNLYFHINIPATEVQKVKKTELMAAFCIKAPDHRNWTNIKTISLGEGQYIAKVDVLEENAPAYAFVNVTDDRGVVSSSKLMSVIPASLGIPSTTKVRRRLMYDGSLGTDVWASPTGKTVKTALGPYDIEGVMSEGNEITTFKPGDLLYRADTDSLLQITLSGKPQSIEIKVADDENSYFCTVDIPNSGEWHKFTLSHNDFKGDAGALDSWANVVMLQLNGEHEFMISSVLWV